MVPSGSGEAPLGNGAGSLTRRVTANRDPACVALERYLHTALMHEAPAAIVKEVNKYLLTVSVNGIVSRM